MPRLTVLINDFFLVFYSNKARYMMKNTSTWVSEIFYPVLRLISPLSILKLMTCLFLPTFNPNSSIFDLLICFSIVILLFIQQNYFLDNILYPGIQREISFSLLSQGSQSLEEKTNKEAIISLYYIKTYVTEICPMY